MGVFSNRIDRESLQPGDHIYSWRKVYTYAHHGIYVEDNKVIHFTNEGQEVGTAGRSVDSFLGSSRSSKSNARVPCTICTPPEKGQMVLTNCLHCFLSGGKLYRYEYSVTDPLRYLAKPRGGTCTQAASDATEIVVKRAKYLLKKNGFGCYHLLKNNCEDFAIYCKTGWIVLGGSIGQSGQVASPVAGAIITMCCVPQVLGGAYMAAAMFPFCPVASVWCITAPLVFNAIAVLNTRFTTDIGSGTRSNALKVSVKDLCQMRSESCVGHEDGACMNMR